MKNQEGKKALNKEIDRLTLELCEDYISDERYEEIMRKLDKLFAIRNNQKSNVDINTVLTVAGSLSGILLILNYERLGAMTSKAVNFVLKGRI